MQHISVLITDILSPFRTYIFVLVIFILTEIPILIAWTIARLTGKKVTLKEAHNFAHNKQLKTWLGLLLFVVICATFVFLVTYAFSKIDQYY